MRERRGLSQGKLARLIGLDHSTVSRWENGERVPKRDNLITASEVMKLGPREMTELLSSFGYSSDDAYIDEPVIHRTYLMLTGDGLSHDARQHLRNTVASACLLARMTERKDDG